MQLQSQLINLFNDLFAQTYNTRLVCALSDGRVGDLDEPVYEPANSQRSYHQVVFAHGYFASAYMKRPIGVWQVRNGACCLILVIGIGLMDGLKASKSNLNRPKLSLKP